MPNTRRRSELVDMITTRGLIARNCGARMAAVGVSIDVAERIMADDPGTLTPAEQQARSDMLPATWLKCWRQGWRDGGPVGGRHE